MQSMRDEHDSLARRLRDSEARHAQYDAARVSVHENEKLAAALRESENALLGERELTSQLNAALTDAPFQVRRYLPPEISVIAS